VPSVPGVPGIGGAMYVLSSDTGGRSSPMRGWGAPSTTNAANGSCGRGFLRSQKKIARPAAAIAATPPTTPPAMAPAFEEVWVGGIPVPGSTSGVLPTASDLLLFQLSSSWDVLLVRAEEEN